MRIEISLQGYLNDNGSLENLPIESIKYPGGTPKSVVDKVTSIRINEKYPKLVEVEFESGYSSNRLSISFFRVVVDVDLHPRYHTNTLILKNSDLQKQYQEEENPYWYMFDILKETYQSASVVIFINSNGEEKILKQRK